MQVVTSVSYHMGEGGGVEAGKSEGPLHIIDPSQGALKHPQHRIKMVFFLLNIEVESMLKWKHQLNIRF